MDEVETHGQEKQEKVVPIGGIDAWDGLARTASFNEGMEGMAA